MYQAVKRNLRKSINLNGNLKYIYKAIKGYESQKMKSIFIEKNFKKMKVFSLKNLQRSIGKTI